MEIAIAEGVLILDQAGPRLAAPVFVRNGICHHPGDPVDQGTTLPADLRYRTAEDCVAKAYLAEIDQGRQFTVAEYNLIARFSGMPSANLCSGE